MVNRTATKGTDKHSKPTNDKKVNDKNGEDEHEQGKKSRDVKENDKLKDRGANGKPKSFVGN